MNLKKGKDDINKEKKAHKVSLEEKKKKWKEERKNRTQGSQREGKKEIERGMKPKGEDKTEGREQIKAVSRQINVGVEIINIKKTRRERRKKTKRWNIITLIKSRLHIQLRPDDLCRCV